ncbi:DNA cytosine methyltransferase, partial [Citrobacter sp. AAK_AS5]
RGVVSGPTRTLAWRVLDAQWFGVAQRRRRVFVVAGAGAVCPEQVLFEFDGVRRDSPPSREARKGVTCVARTLTSNGGGTSQP